MKLITRVASVALMAVAATSSVKAGTGKDVKAPVAPAPATPVFNLTASENYDSRYMFRGVNVIPNAGILSTYLTPIWHITANDTLSAPLCYITAVGKTFNNNMQNYRELDIPVNYTHAFGNLTLGAGYQFYGYFNTPGLVPGGTGVQNEVNVNAAYTYKTGIVTWTPALYYYYELGTKFPYKYGSVYGGSSYLSPQLTASVPLYKDIVTLNPNLQYNFSFRYNPNTQGKAYSGANNLQITAPVTWQITKIISVTGYIAYSYTGANLQGYGGRTSPSTVWGGGNIGFSF